MIRDEFPAWERKVCAMLGIADSRGRFHTSDHLRHPPIQIYGGWLDGHLTVRRDLRNMRVALVAGCFIMVPDTWPHSSELTAIAQRRIFGCPILAVKTANRVRPLSIRDMEEIIRQIAARGDCP